MKVELRLKLLGGSSETEKKENEHPQWEDYGQKTDENAAEVSEYADRVSLQESLGERLLEINLALDAIAKGTYGICSTCGDPIEEARLKVMPTAVTCLTCKRKSA